MTCVALPKRRRGAQSAEARTAYRLERARFAEFILSIRDSIDFIPQSRGWCYILEGHLLIDKGEFDDAQNLIIDMRQTGELPVDIVAPDGARRVQNVEDAVDDETPGEYADYLRSSVLDTHIDLYLPESQWDSQTAYIEAMVEKGDLVSIFNPVCREFGIPIFSAKGWSDTNSRADMLRRMLGHQQAGRRCVVLYCGDHDPGGLIIQSTLRSNLHDLQHVRWSDGASLDNLDIDAIEIDHFGLHYEFIEEHRLTWIDNLITSSGKDLAIGKPNPKAHPDHDKQYVQSYLLRFGARKVEANALVTRIDAGRQLMRDAILRHLDHDAFLEWQERIEAARDELSDLLGGAR